MVEHQRQDTFARDLAGSLRDDERVEHAHGVLLGALEPPLVTNLELADVQVAVGPDCGLDKLVAATLGAVSAAHEQLVLVVAAAFLVLALLHVEQRGGGIAALRKATL
jgi:hypothetical protein